MAKTAEYSVYTYEINVLAEPIVYQQRSAYVFSDGSVGTWATQKKRTAEEMTALYGFPPVGNVYIIHKMPDGEIIGKNYFKTANIAYVNKYATDLAIDLVVKKQKEADAKKVNDLVGIINNNASAENSFLKTAVDIVTGGGANVAEQQAKGFWNKYKTPIIIGGSALFVLTTGGLFLAVRGGAKSGAKSAIKKSKG